MSDIVLNCYGERQKIHVACIFEAKNENQIIKQKTLFKEKNLRIEITVLKMHFWDGVLRLKLCFRARWRVAVKQNFSP